MDLSRHIVEVHSTIEDPRHRLLDSLQRRQIRHIRILIVADCFAA